MSNYNLDNTYLHNSKCDNDNSQQVCCKCIWNNECCNGCQLMQPCEYYSPFMDKELDEIYENEYFEDLNMRHQDYLELMEEWNNFE